MTVVGKARLDRRSFLRGSICTLAAPAIIGTPGLLMPVKMLRAPIGVIVQPCAHVSERLWATVADLDEFSADVDRRMGQEVWDYTQFLASLPATQYVEGVQLVAALERLR